MGLIVSLGAVDGPANLYIPLALILPYTVKLSTGVSVLIPTRSPDTNHVVDAALLIITSNSPLTVPPDKGR